MNWEFRTSIRWITGEARHRAGNTAYPDRSGDAEAMCSTLGTVETLCAHRAEDEATAPGGNGAVVNRRARPAGLRVQVAAGDVDP